MNGRLRAGLLALTAIALLAIPFRQMPLEAQQASSRFRVMVPRLLPGPNSGDNFGERTAEALRDLINDMATHQPVDEDDIEDAMDRFDLDWEDMNCTSSRQLGQQIDTELVFCGSYTREGDNFVVEGRFIGSEGEEFIVDPITVTREEEGREEAARHFQQALERMANQLRYASFCQEYYQSQQWEQALENCNNSMSINQVLRNMDRLEEALEVFQAVLELDPIHESAMQNAGYVSAQLGLDEQAREYYSDYLELNPGNAQIRMSIAQDLAKAGDRLGAMQLIEEGLELEPEHPELLKQHAGFAYFAAAEQNRECREAAEAEDREYGAACPEAAELYQKALESYEVVLELPDVELSAGQLRSIVAAHINLAQYEEAVTTAERILEDHPDAPEVWSIYADALKRTDRVDEAIEALDRVAEIDQEHAASSRVAARQGQWLLEEGRIEESVMAFEKAIDRGEVSADAVSNFFFANGYGEGVEPKNWDYAVNLFTTAKEFDISDGMAQQVNFWLGYSTLQRAIGRSEPNTLETAEATLPRFQEALRLLQSSQGYAQRQNLESTRQELISNTNTFIEIQEAIIKRGR
jgi:tetratricopeptide (TPR) repeat protein